MAQLTLFLHQIFDGYFNNKTTLDDLKETTVLLEPKNRGAIYFNILFLKVLEFTNLVAREQEQPDAFEKKPSECVKYTHCLKMLEFCFQEIEKTSALFLSLFPSRFFYSKIETYLFLAHSCFLQKTSKKNKEREREVNDETKEEVKVTSFHDWNVAFGELHFLLELSHDLGNPTCTSSSWLFGGPSIMDKTACNIYQPEKITKVVPLQLTSLQALSFSSNVFGKRVYLVYFSFLCYPLIYSADQLPLEILRANKIGFSLDDQETKSEKTKNSFDNKDLNLNSTELENIRFSACFSNWSHDENIKQQEETLKEYFSLAFSISHSEIAEIMHRNKEKIRKFVLTKEPEQKTKAVRKDLEEEKKTAIQQTPPTEAAKAILIPAEPQSETKSPAIPPREHVPVSLSVSSLPITTSLQNETKEEKTCLIADLILNENGGEKSKSQSRSSKPKTRRFRSRSFPRNPKNISQKSSPLKKKDLDLPKMREELDHEIRSEELEQKNIRQVEKSKTNNGCKRKFLQKQRPTHQNSKSKNKRRSPTQKTTSSNSHSRSPYSISKSKSRAHSRSRSSSRSRSLSPISSPTSLFHSRLSRPSRSRSSGRRQVIQRRSHSPTPSTDVWRNRMASQSRRRSESPPSKKSHLLPPMPRHQNKQTSKQLLQASKKNWKQENGFAFPSSLNRTVEGNKKSNKVYIPLPPPKGKKFKNFYRAIISKQQ